MSTSERYEKYLKNKHLEWENKCTRCGACCGVVEGDPFEYLEILPNGKYFCGIYENRFGIHKTVSGKEFKCVPIRNILHLSWPGDRCCGYKKKEEF